MKKIEKMTHEELMGLADNDLDDYALRALSEKANEENEQRGKEADERKLELTSAKDLMFFDLERISDHTARIFPIVFDDEKNTCYDPVSGQDRMDCIVMLPRRNVNRLF